MLSIVHIPLQHVPQVQPTSCSVQITVLQQLLDQSSTLSLEPTNSPDSGVGELDFFVFLEGNSKHFI